MIIELANGYTVSVIKGSEANIMTTNANGAEKIQKALIEINDQIKKAAAKGLNFIEYEYENATVATSTNSKLTDSLEYNVDAVSIIEDDQITSSDTRYKISWPKRTS